MRLAAKRICGDLDPVEISRGDLVLRVTARRCGWRVISANGVIAAAGRVRPDSVTLELPGGERQRLAVRDPAGDAVRAMVGTGLAVAIGCCWIAWTARRRSGTVGVVAPAARHGDEPGR